MKSYRSVWTTALGSLGVAGTGVAVLASPESAVWLFVTVSLVAGIAGASILVRISPEPVSWQTRWWSGVRYGVAGGLYVLALVGLDRVLPAWLMVGVIVLTLALFAVGAFRVYRRSTTSEPAPAAGHTDPVDVDVGVLDEYERRLHHASTQAHAMTTVELCDAWPASYVELDHCSDPAARVWIATRRQIFLDELERRDPAGVQAWLSSDARAASNPHKFLTRTEDGRR